MIRSELVHALETENPTLSAKEIERMVTAFFSEIGKHLADGGRVELRGFGVFSTRERVARAGRNPRNGEAVDIPAKRATNFRAGRELRALLNKG